MDGRHTGIGKMNGTLEVAARVMNDEVVKLRFIDEAPFGGEVVGMHAFGIPMDTPAASHKTES